MKILHNISLLPYNTFGIDVSAKKMFVIEEKSELSKLKDSGFNKTNFYILSGGSNVLFTKDYNGSLIHPVFKGIEKIKETESHVWIKVNAGEVWDDFIEFCVLNSYGGIENLSLIPGNCGTAPVQNIGAFGVEVKDTIEEVEIFNINTGEFSILNNQDCEFGYRSSIFKNKLKHSWLIVSTTYKLTVKDHVYNIHYGNIKQELNNFNEINLKTIRQCVINIRSAKLPDPKQIGNAGSFFKNPVVDKAKAEEIKKQYPDVPMFDVSVKKTKLAAGWLIEKCGWKGKKSGNAGVHDKQALVIVNYGKAEGYEIINLSKEIQASVFDNFNIHLEPEVNFL